MCAYRYHIAGFRVAMNVEEDADKREGQREAGTKTVTPIPNPQSLIPSPPQSPSLRRP